KPLASAPGTDSPSRFTSARAKSSHVARRTSVIVGFVAGGRYAEQLDTVSGATARASRPVAVRTPSFLTRRIIWPSLQAGATIAACCDPGGATGMPIVFTLLGLVFTGLQPATGIGSVGEHHAAGGGFGARRA